MVCYQIVMIRALVRAPDASEAVMSFAVIAAVEAFGYHAPLQCYVLTPIYGHRFVDAPACRHVVENDIPVKSSADGIAFATALVAKSYADIADYHLVGIDAEGVTLQTDAVAWRSLSGYRDVRRLYSQWSLKVDGA